jgi:hypothetical protein
MCTNCPNLAPVGWVLSVTRQVHGQYLY